MEFTKLLEKGKIGNLEIKNRFVMPPMGTLHANEKGEVTDSMIAYYKKRAEGGFGLVFIEVTAVDEVGKAAPVQVGLWNDSQIEGFSKLLGSIKNAGAKVFVQLHHAGRQSTQKLFGGPNPEAPSKIACPFCDIIPDEMTNERVWQVIDEFGDAALRAKKAGADGVEIHGAHGYLVAQFMSQHSNRRMDEFGGDFEGRLKFPREIFKNVRKKVGDDFPLSFRFSYDEKVHGGRTLEESMAIAKTAQENGVDVLDISIMTYASLQYMSASPEMPTAFNSFPTKAIKEFVNIPVISVGRYNPFSAETMLELGCADFIAFGRASIADPDLPNKVAEGKTDDIIPCIACTQSCIGYIFNGQIMSCLVNPVTGHELEFDFSQNKDPKKVVIIGAGPAGLQAALAASKLGHDVTVIEKEDKIGGQYRLASIPPTKHEIANALKYLHHASLENGVKFEMNIEATPELIEKLAPDAIILATGGVPARPPIEGLDGKNVVTAIDILDGKVQPGRNVLILGGGMTGVETADFLTEHNRTVTIIDMLPDIAQDEAIIPKAFLKERLRDRPITKIMNAKIKSLTEDGVVYEQDGEEKSADGFDTIVLALGVKPCNALESQLEGKAEKIIVIGDAKKPGPANKASEEGLRAAFEI